MDLIDNTIWSLMAGGLLSLVLTAAADVAMTRSIGAVRSLAFAVAISTLFVFLSGLPEALFPRFPQRLSWALIAGVGPLTSALGLRFLGIWLGGAQEDRVVYGITVWGSHLLLLTAIVLLLTSIVLAPDELPMLLPIVAVFTGVPVALTIVLAVRATLLGDPLGRWLVLACALLAIATTGLYLHAMGLPGIGTLLRSVTAASVVAFMLITMTLIVVRNRANRQLARLARLETGRDPVTGLPTGARLLTEVDHAFWRAGRLHGKCTVVCVYMGNLYDLSEAPGRTSENQILAATAARIRRAAGFRCVVGLYQPRCFVIVFTTDRKRVFDARLLPRLGQQVTQPMWVVGDKDKRHVFTPQVGISVKTVLPDRAVAVDVINEVERQAMDEARPPKSAGDSDLSQRDWTDSRGATNW